MRNKLFISYAWEDIELARWLTAKLSLSGYQVWRDQDRLWGGCKWIGQIDTAINDETFRLVHILSKHSLSKPNPSKERTRALQISKDRNEDFLIPLNTGVAPKDLDWTLSDLNFIDFSNWADGFLQLLETLEKINAPRDQKIADTSFIYFPDKKVIEKSCDPLVSNCFPFIKIPAALHRYELLAHKNCADETNRRKELCYHRQDNDYIWAFPGFSVDGVKQRRTGGTSWRDVPFHQDIGYTAHVTKELLQLSVDRFLKTKGLRTHDKKNYYYFPRAILENDKIKYTNYNNRKTHISVSGQQRDGASSFEYRLAFVFSIRPDICKEHTLQLKIRFQFYKDGKVVDGSDINRLRKKLTKMWNNHKWISRQEAIMSYLSGGAKELVIGEGISVKANPIKGESPHTINEELLNVKTGGQNES